MFHFNGRDNSSSHSNESSSSFHTALNPETESKSSSDDDDDIPTVIGSSPSEIPSVELGQRSGRSERSWSSHGSSSFETSFYSTAFSSDDSRHQSETFYTASSVRDTSEGSQTLRSSSSRSSLYSDEFDSASYTTASSTDDRTSHDFEDPKDIERDFIKSKLRMLRSSRKGTIQSRQDEPKEDAVCEEQQKKFLISHLHALQDRKKKEGGIWRSYQPTQPTHSGQYKSRRRKEEHTEDIVIPRVLVDRLRIENLLHSMRKVSKEPIHEPMKCDSCRTMQQKVTEAEFTRERHRLVYNKYTEERYMRHIVTHDPLTEIGSLAAALPKHSDDPQRIWDKLLQKGIT